MTLSMNPYILDYIRQIHLGMHVLLYFVEKCQNIKSKILKKEKIG